MSKRSGPPKTTGRTAEGQTEASGRAILDLQFTIQHTGSFRVDMNFHEYHKGPNKAKTPEKSGVLCLYGVH